MTAVLKPEHYVTAPVELAEYEHLIALTQDWPEPGVLFRDISPLLAQRFPETMAAFAGLFTPAEIAATDGFAGVDARGFIFAAALAEKFGKSFVMIRKGGKLPPPSFVREYDLEYGSAKLEMKPGRGRLIILDDVLATGGTLAAAADLCREAGYDVTALATLIDLKFLNNFEWNGLTVRSIFQYR